MMPVSPPRVLSPEGAYLCRLVQQDPCYSPASAQNVFFTPPESSPAPTHRSPLQLCPPPEAGSLRRPLPYTPSPHDLGVGEASLRERLSLAERKSAALEASRAAGLRTMASVEDLQAALDAKTRALDESEQEISSLRDQRDSLMHELDTCRSANRRCGDMDLELREKSDEIIALAGQLSAVQQSFDDLQTENAQLTRGGEERDHNLGSLQQQLFDVQQRLQDAERDLEAERHTSSGLRAEHTAQARVTTEAVTALDSENAAMRQQLETLRERARQNEEVVVAFHREAQEVVKQQAALRSEAEEERGMREAVEQQLARTEAEIESLNARYADQRDTERRRAMSSLEALLGGTVRGTRLTVFGRLRRYADINRAERQRRELTEMAAQLSRELEVAATAERDWHNSQKKRAAAEALSGGTRMGYLRVYWARLVQWPREAQRRKRKVEISRMEEERKGRMQKLRAEAQEKTTVPVVTPDVSAELKRLQLRAEIAERDAQRERDIREEGERELGRRLRSAEQEGRALELRERAARERLAATEAQAKRTERVAADHCSRAEASAARAAKAETANSQLRNELQRAQTQLEQLKAENAARCQDLEQRLDDTKTAEADARRAEAESREKTASAEGALGELKALIADLRAERVGSRQHITALERRLEDARDEHSKLRDNRTEGMERERDLTKQLTDLQHTRRRKAEKEESRSDLLEHQLDAQRQLIAELRDELDRKQQSADEQRKTDRRKLKRLTEERDAAVQKAESERKVAAVKAAAAVPVVPHDELVVKLADKERELEVSVAVGRAAEEEAARLREKLLQANSELEDAAKEMGKEREQRRVQRSNHDQELSKLHSEMAVARKAADEADRARRREADLAREINVATEVGKSAARGREKLETSLRVLQDEVTARKISEECRWRALGGAVNRALTAAKDGTPRRDVSASPQLRVTSPDGTYSTSPPRRGSSRSHLVPVQSDSPAEVTSVDHSLTPPRTRDDFSSRNLSGMNDLFGYQGEGHYADVGVMRLPSGGVTLNAEDPGEQTFPAPSQAAGMPGFRSAAADVPLPLSTVARRHSYASDQGIRTQAAGVPLPFTSGFSGLGARSVAADRSLPVSPAVSPSQLALPNTRSYAAAVSLPGSER
eukprot:Hpha_TRINITY_DN16873_c1_g11::TRINITY_DN16873_c1_g11_i1::g.149892::m.149892